MNNPKPHGNTGKKNALKSESDSFISLRVPTKLKSHCVFSANNLNMKLSEWIILALRKEIAEKNKYLIVEHCKDLAIAVNSKMFDGKVHEIMRIEKNIWKQLKGLIFPVCELDQTTSIKFVGHIANEEYLSRYEHNKQFAKKLAEFTVEEFDDQEFAEKLKFYTDKFLIPPNKKSK